MAAVTCAVVALAVPITAVRVIFAIPLCLILPGYALMAATFARTHLEWTQALMLSLALSLVTLVLGSLLLNLAPDGLHSGSWTILLVVVVLGGCAVAARRGRGVFAPPRRRRPLGARRRDVVLLAAAGLATVLGLALSRVPLEARYAVGYTELWMLPSGTARAPSVAVGVLSEEQHATAYRLELRLGAGGLAAARRVELRPGQQSRLRVPLLEQAPGASGVLTAILYKLGSRSVYRQVTAIPSPP